MTVKEFLELEYMTGVSMELTSAHSGKKILSLSGYGSPSKRASKILDQIKDLNIYCVEPKIKLLPNKACACAYLEVVVSGYEINGKLF